MTGSNKVWRMPVACLASVTMLATLGVSALTANADDVEFTFHANGLEFANNTYGDGKTITIKDSNGNGLLDQSEMDKAKDELQLGGMTFTGWFTTPDYGVADTEVEPGTLDATIPVYAHYAASDDVYTVTLNSGTYLTEGNETITLARSSDGVMDRIADWRVPSTDKVDDGFVMDKSVNNGLGTWMASNVAVDFDTTDMWQTLFANDSKTATLNATPVAAYNVTFSQYDFGTKQWELDPKDSDGNYSFDVKQGSRIGEYGEIPVAQRGDKMVTEWKERNDKRAPLIDEDTIPQYNVTYHPAASDTRYTVKLDYNTPDVPDKTVYVEPFSAYETETPTREADDFYEYGFAGWYTDPALKTSFKSGTQVNSNITLHAKWDITGVAFKFDPAYGQEKTVTTVFHNNDKFTAPSFTRKGYVQTGWIVDGVSSSLDAVKGWIGATLTIETNTTNPEKPTAAVKGVWAISGKVETLNDHNFKAVWALGENLADALATVEGYVTTTKDGAYVKGSDQDLYTADSFDEYVTAYQDYLKWKSKNPLKSNADYEEAIAKLVGMQAKLVEVADAPVYRLYNPNNGDHYFTANQQEADGLQQMGWTAEGVRFDAVAVKRGHHFGSPVYSVYNPYTGEHLLTTSSAEASDLKNVGWQWDNSEKPVFYTVQGGSQAVYRVYNPYTAGPAHHYADKEETTGLVDLGWRWDNDGEPLFYFG